MLLNEDPLLEEISLHLLSECFELERPLFLTNRC